MHTYVYKYMNCGLPVYGQELIYYSKHVVSYFIVFCHLVTCYYAVYDSFSIDTGKFGKSFGDKRKCHIQGKLSFMKRLQYYRSVQFSNTQV